MSPDSFWSNILKGTESPKEEAQEASATALAGAYIIHLIFKTILK